MTTGLSKSDSSGFASVSYYEGKWKLLPYLVEFSENDHIVAIANFTNTQSSNGWMLLEVQTRERKVFYFILSILKSTFFKEFLCTLYHIY